MLAHALVKLTGLLEAVASPLPVGFGESFAAPAEEAVRRLLTVTGQEWRRPQACPTTSPTSMLSIVTTSAGGASNLSTDSFAASSDS